MEVVAVIQAVGPAVVVSEEDAVARPEVKKMLRGENPVLPKRIRLIFVRV